MMEATRLSDTYHILDCQVS